MKSLRDKDSSSEELKLMSKEGKLLDSDDEVETILPIKKQVNYENANIFSRLFFSWAKYAMKIANTRGLKTSDVSALQKNQSTEYNSTPLKSSWDYYSKITRKHPLILTILSCYYKIILLLMTLDFFNMLLEYVRIYIFKQLIMCFSKGEYFPERKNFFDVGLKEYIFNFRLNIYEAVFGFLIIRTIRSFFFHQLDFNNTILEEKITNGITAIIFEKILKTNNLIRNSKGEGEKINLIEVDAEKVGSLFSSAPKVVVAPFRITISLYFLFRQFGKKFSYAILILLFVLILILLLQVLYIRNYRKILLAKDARVKIVTFVFEVLKSIKLNGLDDEFIRRIKVKRDEELDYTKKNLNIQILKMLLNSNLFLIIIIFSLNFYMDKNEDIEISSLSSSMQLVGSMTMPIIAIPFFLNQVFSNLLSFERLQNYLFSEDHQPNNHTSQKELEENNIIIKFDKATFGIREKENFINDKNNSNRNRSNDNKIDNIGKINEKYELKEILLESKEKIDIKDNNNNNNISVGLNEKKDIGVNVLNNNYHNNKDLILIKDISLLVKKGEFIAILGPTGSGKSSLLNAIMNNFHIYSSNGPIIINGELSFYAQQPWIMTDTFKNNILFFKQYNEQRYNKVISICQLEQDLKLLAYGDQTEINSTSSNVSGGQKARISLARCLYKDADLYLIDDPFASVDYKVGNKIFKEAFCDYLKDKTRILVTNELNNLSLVDKILYLEKGKIVFSGKYEEFKETFGIKNVLGNSDLEENNFNEEKRDVIKFIRKYSNVSNTNEDEKNNDINKTNIDDEKSNIKENFNDNNKSLIQKSNKYNFENNPLRLLEKARKGKTIDWHIYNDYIKLQGGYLVFLFLLLLIIVSKIIDSYRRTFMTSLTKTVSQIEREKEKKNENHMTNLQKNYSTYVKISFLGIFLNFFVEFIITRTTIHSLRKIHEDMVAKLVRAPINLFHDIVPIGQILNRLTQDIGPVQGIIRTVNFFIRIVFTLITSIGLCYIYNKTTIITSPLLVLICIFITKYYISSGRNLSRLHRISYAPILTILSETIRGVDTIRTGHVEKNIKEKIFQKLDDHFGVHIFTSGCKRWFHLRMRITSHLFFGATLFYMAYCRDKFSANAMAIIIHATEDYIEQLIHAITFFSNLEVTMIGFERCQAVQKIKSENIEPILNNNPNQVLIEKNWPQKGKISFINYSASYRPDTPIILKNISYEFGIGEKVGIVGRTGSGKSSMVLAMARIIEPKAGSITIDDINTQKINLDYLREHLSIVPQDPFLFEGTLKENIDPLKKYSDDKILKVLNDFCLFNELSNKEKLELEIKENGKNLSPGQKQLICFARAVIKNNKIVILDEATSSLDYETEKTIKINMEKYFKDCTLIMITHHISMVKDFKKIIVIDKGEIIESGNYSELMSNKNGAFSSIKEKM